HTTLFRSRALDVDEADEPLRPYPPTDPPSAAAPVAGTRRAPEAGLGSRSALEQRQDDLRRLIGDRQRLRAQLLLNVQRLQARACARHVRTDQVADAG